MGKVITWIIIIALIVWGIFALTGDKPENADVANEAPTESQGTNPAGDTSSDETASAVQVEVSYTDAGYSPKSITINKGDTVVFQNDSDKKMWPASAKHPTHTVYPGSDIKKCDAESDAGTLFDACTGIESGESWSFTFSEVGEWFYHDHLKSSNFGSVTVK